MNPRRPIVVTGSHRSGSSWTGKVIAYSEDVGYIHEPFSVTHHPGMFSARIPYWFTYITEANQHAYLEEMRDTLSFRYKPWPELRAARKPRHLSRLVRDGGRFAKHRASGARPLIKDPLAFFSAAWLASTFDAQVLILVRHPASFAASLLRLGYRHPFEHFLEQPKLMRAHLSSFEEEIRTFAGGARSPLEEAALLWRMISSTIVTYRQRHPEWMFYRYEDLCAAPVTAFREIFRELDLAFTPEIERRLISNTVPNTRAWQSQLTRPEIDWLRDAVGDISSTFYPFSSWEGPSDRDRDPAVMAR